MRRLILLALLALPLPLACKHPGSGGDAGADGAASASASASETVTDAAADVSSAPTATAHGPVGFGPPAAGNPCRTGTDTLGCSTDRTLELTCTGGTWRAMQACRGAGTCKGTGSGVTCDVGNLLIGDPCIAGNPPPHCVAHAVQQCSGGRWAETVCMPPTNCKPNGNGGQAGCK
jgi:hypothetical protein